MGPKNWRVFQKASDAGEIKAEITEAILQEQQKAKEEDDNEAFYVTGRGPVRLAVKSIIVVGLGEKEIQTGKLFSSEKTLAINMTRLTDIQRIRRKDMILVAKCKHPCPCAQCML